MRTALEVVEDLKNRYIDLSEYKRHCIGNYQQWLDDSSVEKEVRNSMEKLEPCLDDKIIEKSESFTESLTHESPKKMINVASVESNSGLVATSPST